MDEEIRFRCPCWGELHAGVAVRIRVPEGVVITEAALRGAEVALAFKPRDRWPRAFQFFRLYW